MDKKQFEKEKQYRIAVFIAKSMLKNGVINEEDFKKVDAILVDKFGSILTGLYPKNNLIQSDTRGNMCD